MILRMWRAHASSEKANDYIQFATKKVFPSLREVPGHQGAYLVRRTDTQGVDFMVFTLWESMDSVRRFAGAEPERAVVEPEARAILSRFDKSVIHFEVVATPTATMEK